MSLFIVLSTLVMKLWNKLSDTGMNIGLGLSAFRAEVIEMKERVAGEVNQEFYWWKIVGERFNGSEFFLIESHIEVSLNVSLQIWTHL